MGNMANVIVCVESFLFGDLGVTTTPGQCWGQL